MSKQNVSTNFIVDIPILPAPEVDDAISMKSGSVMSDMSNVSNILVRALKKVQASDEK